VNAQAAQILLGALAQVPNAARDLDGWDHDGRGGWNQARPSGHSSTSAGRLSTC
jgi:hypothetical protein